MYTVTANNISEAIKPTLELLESSGEETMSSKGKFLELKHPLSITLWNPTERCILISDYIWNPIEAFNDAMFAIAGMQVGNPFSDRLRNFDTIVHARHKKSRSSGDQLKDLINLLSYDRQSSKAILQFWDYRFDGPCNYQSQSLKYLNFIFARQDDELRLTVFNRGCDFIRNFISNDVVAISIIHEYVAANLNIKVGSCTYIFNNLSIGLEDPILPSLKTKPVEYQKPAMPMINNKRVWDKELRTFLRNGRKGYYKEPWFNKVMSPLVKIRDLLVHLEFQTAFEVVETIEALEIKQATKRWLEKELYLAKQRTMFI